MSATAAQSEYVLIPSDRGFPSIISENDAHTRIRTHHHENYDRDSRFSDLLAQRGAGDMPFWFTGSDVIVRGNVETAWSIRNVVHEMPNMMRSVKGDNDNGHNIVAFQPKEHIATAFAEAVNPLLKAPDMGVSFKLASAYETMTGNRLPRFGYRQSEGMHNRM